MVLFGHMIGCSKHSFIFLHVGLNYSLHCILSGGFFLLLCFPQSPSVSIIKSMVPLHISQGWKTWHLFSLARRLYFKVHPFSRYTLLLADPNGPDSHCDRPKTPGSINKQCNYWIHSCMSAWSFSPTQGHTHTCLQKNNSQLHRM